VSAVAINDDPALLNPVPFAYGHLVLGGDVRIRWAARPGGGDRDDLAQEADDRLATGSCELANLLAITGRSEQAQVLAERAGGATRASGIPAQTAFALRGYGHAFAEADPPGAGAGRDATRLGGRSRKWEQLE
jgi:hypothetical protein